MDKGESRWFIDAWAVLDGYAFASLRPPNSINAEVIFFVAPPYFEPEPVASLATALAATRGHFQEGLRGPGGAEIGFATLEQVIEAIRRGYRAGGLDLGGAGAAAPIPAPPTEPAGGAGVVHPSQLVDEEMKEIWARLGPELTNPTTGAAHEKRLQQSLVQLLERAMPALLPKFVGYAAASMLVQLAGETQERSARAREACAWIDKARALGVEIRVSPRIPSRPSTVHAHAMGAETGFEWPTPKLDLLPREFFDFVDLQAYRTNGSAISEVDLPFMVPIAAVFQAGRGRYPTIPTLGHLMAAATADRRYVYALESVHEIVPLLVLALVQVSPAASPHPVFPPRRGTPEGHDVCERAASWLARALPSGMLDRHDAEQALHDLTVSLLGWGDEDDGDEGTPARTVTLDLPPDRSDSPGPSRVA